MMKLYFHSSQTGRDYTSSVEQQDARARCSNITAFSIGLSGTIRPVLISSPHNYRQLFSLTPSWTENCFSHANYAATGWSLESSPLLKLFPNGMKHLHQSPEMMLAYRFNRYHLRAKINISKRTGSSWRTTCICKGWLINHILIMNMR